MLVAFAQCSRDASFHLLRGNPLFVVVMGQF
jgi:hypothetical protein